MKMSERERAYVEVCARDMHPDLYESIEESAAAKELRKRFETSDQLERLRRLMMHDEWPVDNLNLGYGLTTISVTEYNYSAEFKDSGYIDQAASLRSMRRLVQLLKREGAKIEKEMKDSDVTVKAHFDDGLTITIIMNRGAVCERKVVSQEWVEPSKGYYRDIVEWDCKPVSILKSGDV
jgi:hypothetical protein